MSEFSPPYIYEGLYEDEERKRHLEVFDVGAVCSTEYFSDAEVFSLMRPDSSPLTSYILHRTQKVIKEAYRGSGSAELG